jgi:uncharacterized protein YggE
MRTKLFLIVSVLAAALVLSACGPAATSAAAPRTLSVSGNGTVFLTPDIAYINIGVHTENADIAQAVESNNTQAEALVNALVGMGVAATDIQTSSFSVYSSQTYGPDGLLAGYTYMVDNIVYVTVRDLTQLGSLLNTAVGTGANNISSIQFDVADKTAAMAEARQKAMTSAASLAQELADTAGLQLGEIQSITYSDYVPSPYYFGAGIGAGGGSSAPNASVPIQPGQQQIVVTVNVTYAVK